MQQSNLSMYKVLNSTKNKRYIMSVGANIRKRRCELNMTQQDLAEAMGYKNRATIAKIESGENDITQKKLQKIATILDTSIENLIGGLSSITLPISVPVESITDSENRNKNIAIIMAGGKSSRNQQNIPNQFINVLGKPIIVYSMEAYQQHPTIDDIYVVCLRGWENVVKAYAEQFNISKLRGIIPAGNTGILSVKNGINHIKSNYNPNDIIFIQESTRPMVSVEIISKLMQTCMTLGSGSVCQFMRDYVQFTLTNSKSSYIDRDAIVELQSPEAFQLHIIEKLFDYAESTNHELTESCCGLLLYNLGKDINFVEGSVNNIKIIRQEDIGHFSAIIRQTMSY